MYLLPAQNALYFVPSLNCTWLCGVFSIARRSLKLLGSKWIKHSRSGIARTAKESWFLLVWSLGDQSLFKLSTWYSTSRQRKDQKYQTQWAKFLSFVGDLLWSRHRSQFPRSLECASPSFPFLRLSPLTRLFLMILMKTPLWWLLAAILRPRFKAKYSEARTLIDYSNKVSYAAEQLIIIR